MNNAHKICMYINVMRQEIKNSKIKVESRTNEIDKLFSLLCRRNLPCFKN